MIKLENRLNELQGKTPVTSTQVKRERQEETVDLTAEPVPTKRKRAKVSLPNNEIIDLTLD